jgi:hypothetical protein
MAEPLVLINAFEVPAAEAEKFIAAWEQSRDCAQEFLAATQSLGFRQAAAGLADYRPDPGLVSGCAHLRTAADLLDVRPGDTVRTVGRTSRRRARDEDRHVHRGIPSASAGPEAPRAAA